MSDRRNRQRQRSLNDDRFEPLFIASRAVPGLQRELLGPGFRWTAAANEA
jgi:hypothetical protein